MLSEIPSSPFSKKKNALKMISYAGLVSLLAGCASKPPENFPPPDFSYLPKMNLNIAHLNVYDNAVPKRKNSLSAQSPTPPDQALTLMANQRLNATGNSGIGTFTVASARISRSSDNVLVGMMSVRLTLSDPANGHHGEVTASVTHQDNVSGENSKQHDLYELNRHLMDDMNVELEYQIRKNLGDWLTDATGAPLNAAVKSQNLESINAQMNDQGTSSAEAPPLSSTMTAPAPAQSGYHGSVPPTTTAPSAPSPSATRQLHSPPAGVLHLPY